MLITTDNDLVPVRELCQGEKVRLAFSSTTFTALVKILSENVNQDTKSISVEYGGPATVYLPTAYITE